MIYIICDHNGQTINIPFNGEKTKLPEGAIPKYVGIRKKRHSLAVSLHQKRIQLMDNNFDTITIKNDDCYTGWNGSKAIQNWDGKTLTQHLLQQSSELRAYLKEGEYVPSLPELAFICAHQDDLNTALEFVGGEQFAISDYWSSTEYSEYGAWYIYFTFGNFSINNKCYSSYVRPIVTFSTRRKIN